MRDIGFRGRFGVDVEKKGEGKEGSLFLALLLVPLTSTEKFRCIVGWVLNFTLQA